MKRRCTNKKKGGKTTYWLEFYKFMTLVNKNNFECLRDKASSFQRKFKKWNEQWSELRSDYRLLFFVSQQLHVTAIKSFWRERSMKNSITAYENSMKLRAWLIDFCKAFILMSKLVMIIIKILSKLSIIFKTSNNYLQNASLLNFYKLILFIFDKDVRIIQDTKNFYHV